MNNVNPWCCHLYGFGSEKLVREAVSSQPFKLRSLCVDVERHADVCMMIEARSELRWRLELK